MANIEEKVQELIEPIIKKLGYSVYDVRYEKEAKDFYLRVFIDSDKGIDLNDCEKVNNAITDELDKADYIKDAYFLEVSSCGLERILRKDSHFKDVINKQIELKLFKAINKQKSLQGILKKIDKEKLVLNIDEKEIEIERKNISQAKTVYNWEE